MIEKSAVLDDTPQIHLLQAPVLVDLDVIHDLQTYLSRIKANVSKHMSSEETRIDFIIQSLEFQLESTGNQSVKTAKMYSHGKNSATSIWTQNAVYAEVPPISDPHTQYVQKSSLISQVVDLFPNLGDGFVEVCLNEWNDSVEQVVDRVLTENFPPHIAALDRGLARGGAIPLPTVDLGLQVALAPQHNEVLNDVALDEGEKQSLLAGRRNIHDGDEFDVFAHGAPKESSRVIHGKKEL